MPNPLIAVAGSGVLGAAGAVGQASAAKKAASAQERAAAESTRLQKEMFDQQVAMQEPFRQAGITGQNRMMDLMGLSGNAGAEGYGRYARDFGMNDFQADPGYAFRLAEGNKALERSAAARGMVLSGSMFKGLQRYGQDYAGTKLDASFNRLSSLANAGQPGAGQIGAATANYGNNVGANTMNQGDANAMKYLVGGNALGTAVNGLTAYGERKGWWQP